MPRAPRPVATRRFVLVLAAIACVAALGRIAYTVDTRSDQELGLSDEFYYSFQGRQLADGEGFVDPFAFALDDRKVPDAGHPPLYGITLAVPSALGIEGHLGHRLFTGLFGVATVVALGLLVRDLAGERAGLVAAALAAVYPHLWINDSVLGAESLYGLLVTLMLIAFYRFRRSPTLLGAGLLALALSAGVLTRSETMFLFPLIAVPAALCARQVEWRRRWQMLGVMVLVPVLVVGPWVIRNNVEFDEPVGLVTGSGVVLAYGNCDRTYSGQFLGYWHDDCALKVFPEGDQSVVDAAAREKGVEYIQDHLGDVPRVVAARVGRLWDVYRPMQNVEFNGFFERRGDAESLAALWAYWALLPLGIAGLVVLRRRGQAIYPFLAIAATVTMAAALSFGITRYRNPVDVVLPALAAVAIDAAWRRFGRSSGSPSDAREPDATSPGPSGELVPSTPVSS